MRVRVVSPELTHTNPGFTNVAPFRTHLQAVVSARFCTAAALLGKPVEEHDFYDRLEDPEVLALARKIELEPHPSDTERVAIEVDTPGGVVRAEGIENDTLRPSNDKIVAKFHRLAGAVPAGVRERIVETVMRLEQVTDIRELVSLLSPGR